MNTIASRLAAALLALGIFLFDVLAPLEGAIAVLYVLVVLLAARTESRGDILIATVASIALALVAYGLTHGFGEPGAPGLRVLVSVAATTIAAALALKKQAATAALARQARLLDLSHDMIVVRDPLDRITFWNRAAEETYGWTRAEAHGCVADELLEARYPLARSEVTRLVRETGRWDGIVEHRTKAGPWVTVESRWALQKDVRGHVVGIFETNTNVTERNAAHAALVRSERRYRRMFDASRVGVVEEDWSAVRAALAKLDPRDRAQIADDPDFVARMRKVTRIVAVNPSFLAMVGASGASSVELSVDEVLSETDTTFGPALAAFARGDSFHEGETEVLSADGRRVPVLFAITFPPPGEGDDVLVFVVDIAERRQAEDALIQAQAELARASRGATLGALTASIAHEVNQPLMAVVTNCEAALRWLRRDQPDLKEVDHAIERSVAEGRRASEIVRRVRAFLTKTPPQPKLLALAPLIEEAVQLVQRQLALAGVEIRLDLAHDRQLVIGDRIQLQQVIVNLMINAAQAMASQDGRRLLTITVDGCPSHVPEGFVGIAVADSGPGIAPRDCERVFEPFFTTRPDGMGMGLAICRSTAEAHGGKLSAESSLDGGATFRLLLPTSQHGTAA